MNKYKETFGIDISKDVFDCYGSIHGHLQFKNSAVGFQSLKHLQNYVVMLVLQQPLGSLGAVYEENQELVKS